MRKIKGYILLVRPVNIFMAFLSVYIGGFVTGSTEPIIKLLMACLSGSFIGAGAYSLNDYYDLEIDRINKPARPLPKGMITRRGAFFFSLCLFGLGLLIAFFINGACFFIALGSFILLYFYNRNLKSTVLWGNLTVAIITGMTFIYGGLSVGHVGQAFFVGCIAFCYHLAREIIKDIEDVTGDQSQGIQTFPIKYGVKTSLHLVTGVVILLIGVTLVPYFLGIFSVAYLIVILLGVDLFLVFVIFSMWYSQESKNMRQLSFLMKLNMLVGLFAVYIGS